MLFNFRLVPIKDAAPFGDENQWSLHWFGLTDGWYWLNVGDDKLFRFSDAWINKWKAVGETWEHPYVGYQVVRLWEDIQEILPSVLEPIPEAMRRRYDPDQEGWLFLQQVDAWLEQHDDWDTGYTATNWLCGRQLDTSYLIHPPRIRFWTDGIDLHITWHNQDYQTDGIPIWSTQEGQVVMPLTDFIDEVRSFDERLIAAMAERIQSAKADWPLPDVEIDIDRMEMEHRERSGWMTHAFELAQQVNTNWDVVMAAINKVEY